MHFLLRNPEHSNSSDCLGDPDQNTNVMQDMNLFQKEHGAIRLVDSGPEYGGKKIRVR